MDYKEIDDLISEALKYPDLEIRKSQLGLVYRPNSEERDENGYIKIENIEDYPEFSQEVISPRTGVGHIDPISGERLKHVEFLQYDEEDIYGRNMPEFGFKYSKFIPDPEPLGIINILHEYGVKGKSTDFRYTRPKQPSKNTYIFMYIFDNDDEKNGYYTLVNPRARKNPEMKELVEMYYKRFERIHHIKVTLAGFLKKYRLELLPSFFVEKSKFGTKISYGFHPKVDFEINGTSRLKDIENFISKSESFINNSIRYIHSMMIIRKVPIDEYKYILNELNTIKDLLLDAERTLQDILSNFNNDTIFDVMKHDWFINTSDEIREKVSLFQMRKPIGPIQELKSKLNRILTPRQEQLEDIRTGNFHDGFLFIDPIEKMMYRNIGEIIRSQNLYEEIGKDEIEEEINSYIFNEKKKRMDRK